MTIIADYLVLIWRHGSSNHYYNVDRLVHISRAPGQNGNYWSLDNKKIQGIFKFGIQLIYPEYSENCTWKFPHFSYYVANEDRYKGPIQCKYVMFPVQGFPL